MKCPPVLAAQACADMDALTNVVIDRLKAGSSLLA